LYRLCAWPHDEWRCCYALQANPNLAEERAALLEEDAGFAIDYAIASIEQAQLAVLDAIDARRAAQQARRS
jgi:hypothetical protein